MTPVIVAGLFVSRFMASPAIKDVDFVGGKVLVTFTDGTAALFNAEFLYAHRSNDGNTPLPPEPGEN